MYAQKIEGNNWVGETMDKGKIEKMSGEDIRCTKVASTCINGIFVTDQQLGQLYELMQASKKQGQEDGGDDESAP